MFKVDTPIISLKPPADAFGAIDASKEPRGYMISALSEVQDEAFAFLEYWVTPEGNITEKLGLEGIHHNVKDGAYVLTDQHPTFESRFFYPKLEDPVKVLVLAAAQSLDYADKMVTFDNMFAYPEELQPQADNANNTYQEYSYKFITGEMPLSDFDKYVELWLNNGGQAITDYANSVLK
jgi:putative aldouronate transport system substrate-binding protein